MTRSCLKAICRALVGVLLLAQLVVSAHACPAASAAAPGQAMVDCAHMNAATPVDMDPDFANLCAEHCHHGQQSDHAASLTLPAAVMNALYTTSVATPPALAPRPAAASTSALAAASPPLAILHCCFRI